MKTYPNQKYIIDRQIQEKDTLNENYHTTLISSKEYARKILTDKGRYTGIKYKNSNVFTPFAYLLWDYITENSDSFQFALSYSAVSQQIIMSKDTYYKCIRMLELENFLVLNPVTKTHYVFFENPSRHIEEINKLQCGQATTTKEEIKEDTKETIEEIKEEIKTDKEVLQEIKVESKLDTFCGNPPIKEDIKEDIEVIQDKENNVTTITLSQDTLYNLQSRNKRRNTSQRKQLFNSYI